MRRSGHHIQLIELKLYHFQLLCSVIFMFYFHFEYSTESQLTLTLVTTTKIIKNVIYCCIETELLPQYLHKIIIDLARQMTHVNILMLMQEV